MIAKAEVLQDKDNPRFIVTNLPAEGFEHLVLGLGDSRHVIRQR